MPDAPQTREVDARRPPPRSDRTAPSAVVLVDFQNVFFNLAFSDSYDWLPAELESFVAAAVAADTSPEWIAVRLYGSWVEDGLLTKQGSLAQQAIAQGPAFPLVVGRRVVAGEIELALSLVDLPSIRWPSFIKRQQGLSRVKIAKSLLPKNCIDDRTLCPIRSLQHFSHGRERKCSAAGCEVLNNQAFETTTQKMVDTLLACDLMELARKPATRAILVVTGDVDLMPAVATAANARNAKITLITTLSRNSLVPYSAFLQSLGVQVRDRRPR